MSEQILCVSYFDQVIGPNLFYCSEEHLEGPEYPDLGRILEFNESEGSFIFAFRKYQTLNHIFFIDSNVARGRKEILMITYLIKSAYFKNEIADVFKDQFDDLTEEELVRTFREQKSKQILES